MAIAFDTSTESSKYTSGSSHSWSHTCTGSDRILIVFAYSYKSGGSTISGITYNGVSMTEIGTYERAQTEVRCHMFYLVNPATGSNSIAATYAGSTPYFWGMASSYTGVDQTTPIDSSAGAEGNGSPTASDRVAVTIVVDSNCWLVSGCVSTGNAKGTVSSGSVRQWMNASHRWGQIADSNGTVSTGSQNITHQINSGNWAWHVASLAEADSGTDYPLTAALGTFTLTGIATALEKAMTLVASVGSFVLTGIAVTLLAGASLTAATGSFVLTGTATAFSRARSLVADLGTFTLTGLSVVFDIPVKLTAAVGSFILTGVDAILRPSNIVKNQSKISASTQNESKTSSSVVNISKP